MLAQTTVAAVAPRFSEWMRRYPDVETLAKVSEREVLRAWEGLGYYARARNLLKTARIISAGGGKFPAEMDSLRALPGVGEYTAAAILSLAFGKSYRAEDANVRRITERVGKKFPMPRDRPGDFNEALMDFGSLICLPRNPKCGICPIRKNCRTRGAFPRAKRKITNRRSTIFIVRNGDRILLTPRSGGLWGFPTAGEWPIERKLPAFIHTYTRYRERITPVLARGNGQAPAGCRWVRISALNRYPLPSPYRRMLSSNAWRSATS